MGRTLTVCDEKTVQMIGTMVKNRPRDSNAFVRSRPLLPPWETQGHDTLGLFDKGKSREITPNNGSKEPRTTLVLAPASLLQQVRPICILAGLVHRFAHITHISGTKR